MSKKIKQATEYLRKYIEEKPLTGIILGSGLGDFVDCIKDLRSTPFTDIPGFPVSTVDGHKGNFILGNIDKKPIIALQGRLHGYEGYNAHEIVFPMMVMNELGIETLILSNASGGLNPEFEIGDIMIIEDHINLSGENPLKGLQNSNNNFIDMSNPYNSSFIEMAEEIAERKKIRIKKGVYAGVTGPTYETPAEYKYLRIIGADAVGMSTVNEVIAARKMNIDCLAFSVISDLGVPGKIVPLSHEDVLREAEKAEPILAEIIIDFIRKF